MYIQRDNVAGMGIRGMGQTAADQTSTTVLNYPGMPTATDQNQMIAVPLTASQLASLSASNAAFFNQPASTGSTFADWWNQNPGIVAFGEAVVLVWAIASLIGGGRRR